MGLKEAAQQATPKEQLLKELMDSRVSKTEREHAAAREIEKLRAANQQALEALGSAGSVFKGEHDTCGGCPWCDAPSYGPCEPHCDKDRAVKALRASLAEGVPEINFGNMAQGVDSTEADHVPDATKMMASVREDRTVEPVAYIKGYSKGRCIIKAVDPDWLLPVGMALYRSPPKREPLTESFLEELAEKHVTNCYFDTLTYAREIERLHEIGGEE